jgi:hypothetical protein
MTTIARQYPLKYQIRSIVIASILFAIVALVALFARSYRPFHGASTSSPSRPHDSSIPVAPGGASSAPRTGRLMNNPFRGFRP